MFGILFPCGSPLERFFLANGGTEAGYGFWLMLAQKGEKGEKGE